MTTKSERPRNSRRPPEPNEASSPEPPLVRGAESVRPPKEPRTGPRFPRLARVGVALKLAFGAAIVIGASAGVAWGAKRYVTTSPRFAIKTVAVEGNARRTPQDLAREGNIVVGDNVFALDLDQAAREIEKDPWVKSAKVTRKLPGSVVVAITEHEPAALVSIEDKLFIASRDGDVFKEAAPEDPMDLPLVTGVVAADVARDREGVQKSIVKALDVVDEVQRSQIAARYPVEEVHLESDGTLVVIVGRDAIALHLGRAPFRGKLEQAERVFAELEKRKAEPSIVFLDNENSPERVVVRMR